MADRPINPDREQQRKDNVASRRQSGLEPLPRDREDEDAAKKRGGQSDDAEAKTETDRAS